MDINQALANVGVYNALIDCPTVGIHALELYKRGSKKYEKEIRRDLKICQTFCRSFLSIIEGKVSFRALAQNVFVYSGIKKAFTEEERKEKKEQLIELNNLITEILSQDINGEVNDREKVKKIEENIKFLSKVRKHCEKKLYNPESEALVIGIV